MRFFRGASKTLTTLPTGYCRNNENLIDRVFERICGGVTANPLLGEKIFLPVSTESKDYIFPVDLQCFF